MLLELALALAQPTREIVVDKLLIAEQAGGVWRMPSDKGAKEGTKRPSRTYSTVSLNGALSGPSKGQLEFTESGVVGWFMSGEKELPRVLYTGPKLNPVKYVDGSQSEVYKGIATEFLKQKGVPDPQFRFLHVYSLDLNRDGQNEVLFDCGSDTEENLRSMTGIESKSVNFSMVFVRAIIKGKPTNITIRLSRSNENSLGEIHRILSIADFDGDKKPEFLVTDDYYEGQGANLMRFDGKNVITIVSNGAGV